MPEEADERICMQRIAYSRRMNAAGNPDRVKQWDFSNVSPCDRNAQKEKAEIVRLYGIMQNFAKTVQLVAETVQFLAETR